LTGVLDGLGFCCPVKQRRALLESNSPRDNWIEGDEIEPSPHLGRTKPPQMKKETIYFRAEHALKNSSLSPRRFGPRLLLRELAAERRNVFLAGDIGARPTHKLLSVPSTGEGLQDGLYVKASQETKRSQSLSRSSRTSLRNGNAPFPNPGKSGTPERQRRLKGLGSLAAAA
jgi:hypothetical protein